MGNRGGHQRNRPARIEALLIVADRLATQPTEQLMDDLGLPRDTAEGWQRICAELAASVRWERRPMRAVGRRWRVSTMPET